MKLNRVRLFSLTSIIVLGVFLIFAPALIQSGISIPFCEMPKVSAQDDPCLDREVTISALEVEILRLQGTMNAQEIINLGLANRNLALEATIRSRAYSPQNQVVITVPVIVTATNSLLPTRTTTLSVSPLHTITPLSDNCATHTVVAGDTPFGIAEQYDVDGNLLMTINGLDETTASFMEIGDVLIIPLSGCSLRETPSPLSATTATDIANTTLPPTATNSQVEIVRVFSPGDINVEGIDIRNNGSVIDMTGWELSVNSGETYIFPQQRVFTGGVLTIYTRVGSDTPQAKFWGLDVALWESGDVLVLRDADGNVQSVLQVP